jgi:ankyrin repeat protein
LIEKSRLDLNEPSEDGYYLIHRAATVGSVQCLEYLIQHGAKVNVFDRHGYLPLELAVFEGEFDCASYLIQQGACINNIRNGSRDIGIAGRSMVLRT